MRRDFSWRRFGQAAQDVLLPVRGLRAVIAQLTAISAATGLTLHFLPFDEALPTWQGRALVGFVVALIILLGIRAAYALRKQIESLRDERRIARDDRRDTVRKALHHVNRGFILVFAENPERGVELKARFQELAEAVANLPLQDARALTNLCATTLISIDQGDFDAAYFQYKRIEAYIAAWPISYRDEEHADETLARVKSFVAVDPKIAERLSEVLESLGATKDEIARIFPPPKRGSP